MDVATLLPADDSSEGFDNIADALSVSPSLIQGYVSAAMKISRQAVGDRTLAPSQITYSAPGRLAQDRHIEGLPLGTRGGMLVRHTFPLDAEYEFSWSAAAGRRRHRGGAAIDVTLDGESVDGRQPASFRLRITAGPHTIGVALVDRQRGAGVDDIYSDFRTNAAFTPAGRRADASPSPGRSTPPASATRRAGARSSCVTRRGQRRRATNAVRCARQIVTALARACLSRARVGARRSTR